MVGLSRGQAQWFNSGTVIHQQRVAICAKTDAQSQSLPELT